MNYLRMSSSFTEPHLYFPVQVEMLIGLRSSRRNSGEKMSINILLTSATTSFLERIMAGLLLKIVGKAFFPLIQEPIYWRLYESRVTSIKNGTFSVYEKEIKSLTNRSFEKFTTQKLWASVKMLFRLRNHILHGQEINVGQFYDESKNEYYFEVDNLKSFQEYLISNRLLDKTLKSIGPSNIVNDEIISHFLVTTYEFVKISHSNIIAEYEQQPLDRMEHTLTELKRILSNLNGM